MVTTTPTYTHLWGWASTTVRAHALPPPLSSTAARRRAPLLRLRRKHRPKPRWPRGPVLLELDRRQPGRRLRQTREGRERVARVCSRAYALGSRCRSALAGAPQSSRTTLCGPQRGMSPSAGPRCPSGSPQEATLGRLHLRIPPLRLSLTSHKRCSVSHWRSEPGRWLRCTAMLWELRSQLMYSSSHPGLWRSVGTSSVRPHPALKTGRFN